MTGVGAVWSRAELFKLMNEVESEDLVFTLETIVDKFGEEMAPYAMGLVTNLVRTSKGGKGVKVKLGCNRLLAI